MRRYLAIAVCLLAAVGARPQCDARTGFTQCDAIDVAVDPGACVEVTVDCAGDVSDLGSFALDDTFAGLWVRVERRASGNTLRVCADADMPVLSSEPVEFVYVRRDGEAFVGVFNLTVGLPLAARATADPTAIAPGKTSQLGVEVSGGTPPYSYLWQYSDAFVGAYDIPDPVVKPAEGEIFGVQVRDSRGERATSSVLVDVIPAVNAIAVPESINVGETVSLGAGVSPPLVTGTHLGWTWVPDVPAGAPLDPDAANTSASPQESTLYIYSVRTFYGTVAADSARVYVRPVE